MFIVGIDPGTRLLDCFQSGTNIFVDNFSKLSLKKGYMIFSPRNSGPGSETIFRKKN